ncbi:MAG TPA: DUF1464 family protein [Nitrososphaerales archaeon]|jgi:predicted butyrate kinase (DUF1464 family)|nr:DUF1464 family protein [Nitrososphaerales archaeon]|tara:strand:+ start:854 stop:1942 length:1089 start_codon:yes stop_codon:yes gene_type:complete
MVKVVGIDPGTKSFDLCGLNEGRLFLERSILSADIAKNPGIVIDALKSVGDLDAIVGPSGYGLPLTHISQVGDKENFEMILTKPDDKTGVIVGLSKLVKLMRKENLNVFFIPGVIHLKTVPEHRKANKIDLGTPDKLCSATLGVFDQSKRLGISYEETSFIMVEIGFAFNAIIGVDKGKIISGIGGTSAGPAFAAQGKMDGELAYILDTITKNTLFEGGAKSIAEETMITPEEFSNKHNSSEKLRIAWNALIEGIECDVASTNVAVKKPREILISGRLSILPKIRNEISKRLNKYGDVKEIQGFTQNVKEASQGAALIADGLAGGEYKELIEVLDIRNANGSVLDHIHLSRINEIRKRYGII